MAFPASGQRVAALALGVAIIAGMAGAAQARPDTRAMSCEGARGFVAAHGAVVMTTGQYTYERIVAGYGFCEPDEEIATKYAPTADNPRCPVGYYCRPARIIEFGPGFGR